MNVLETTAVVHNHRIVLEVPEGFPEGSTIRVTLAPPVVSSAEDRRSVDSGALNRAQRIALLEAIERIPVKPGIPGAVDEIIAENRECWDDDE
jgi:hypothetical protein